ncbi:MAG: UDP-N-acetylmuramate:L-alanyl-gamma-D-glutamyl-meso-diaminopimelate ligase [Gammaproteobacteria bacterium]|nr:UDP-N-acetylmuramate:L-alanyl-gamma-D-glutamyl-meso-diaminopimelate ligase [Gammaproteobacteria bacterium]MDH4313586.1 UDP-N-acetylmuramate:L-alanyl-gamma-D-glutamyl-meso-diaminopimelate ligase [Gammaproteobacteria bacterium]MDH5213363.1 UDP-N-acetylmuramate:L-alanyl-gamma-D-glutamyl-meso-diaminopimelate ligase [Gammaproteobacteria bacterium]
MHIHILGICGTFMGGVAALAKAAGHRVSGSDQNVYPPMSTQLRQLGIEIVNGYDTAQLEPVPDCVVIGNALSRGNVTVEAILDRRIPYCSGPQWLADHVLQGRHVMAIAGTHGKTTTASMLAWILHDAGLAPGFLIGGLPANFPESARFGESEYFVVEADEYDTAFFDKRAKFVHYRPQTLVINNIEFDHADIYRDVEAILWQFHQLLRIVPSGGRIIRKADDSNIDVLVEKGCWTPLESFGLDDEGEWHGSFLDSGERRIRIEHASGDVADTVWKLGGTHNLENALAAVAASRSAGVPFNRAVDALSRFEGVKRRMERTATVSEIAIYDDFAHHPTAIKRTLSGLRNRYPGQRIVVALELRSNTMKLGVHNRSLVESLNDADLVFVFRPGDMRGELDDALAEAGSRLSVFAEYDDLVTALLDNLLAGDQLVFMSNGGFGASRQKLTMALQQKRAI